MKVTIELDLSEEGDIREYQTMYHAQTMLVALYNIQNDVRGASQNDWSADYLISRLKETLAELPSERLEE